MHNDKFFKDALWNSAICCNYTYTWKRTSNQCRDCHIFSFCVFPSGSNLTRVRFPKERIRKGLTGSLRVSLTHCLCQSEKYGAGGEVTFFNFASNRSKWTKHSSESAFFFQFKCRKVVQKNWRWFSFYNIKTMVGLLWQLSLHKITIVIILSQHCIHHHLPSSWSGQEDWRLEVSMSLLDQSSSTPFLDSLWSITGSS